MITATFAFDAYRAREPVTDVNSTTWTYAQDTDWVQPLDSKFSLRVLSQETGGGEANNVDIHLEYRVNGGTWGVADALLAASDVTTYTNGDAITSGQLGGTGTFLNGAARTSANLTADYVYNVTANTHTEVEYLLVLDSGTFSAGDQVDFRITFDAAVETQNVMATASVPVVGTAALDGSADFAPTGEATALGASVLDGAADFAPTGFFVPTKWFGDVTFNGAGDLQPRLIGRYSGQSAFDGDSDLLPTGLAIALGATPFDGAGDFAGSALATAVAQSTLNGAADLLPTALAIALGQVQVDGDADLTATATITAFGATLFDAAGDFAPTATVKPYILYFPDEDITQGGWVTAPLFSKVDEPFPGDDADFISSTDTSLTELGLQDGATPGDGTVTLYVRARRQSANLGDLRVRLMEGATERANWLISNPSQSFTLYPLDLTAGEVTAITDWTNLRVQLARE